MTADENRDPLKGIESVLDVDSVRRFKAKILATNYKIHNKFINRMYDNDSTNDRDRKVEEKYSD